MSIVEAYQFFKQLEKQMDEINSLYNNLKVDIKDMMPGQIKIQSRKILHRLSKIDLEEIKNKIKEASGYALEKNLRNRGEETIQTIEKIKKFIYSIENYQETIKAQEDDVVLPPTKKLDFIKDKYTFLQKEIDSADTSTIIKDAKRLENTLSRLNFEDLPEGDYDEMVNIKNDVSKMIRTFQGVEKSEKYGPYIHEPLVKLILDVFTHDQEQAETKAATILDFIEDPERIHMFEPAMRRIIAKKMTPKEFRTFFKSVISMMKGERKFESFGDYKERYELFYLI